MVSDSEVKKRVENELEWDADVNASDIAVTVKGSVVTLAGFAHSYSDKVQAERAAKRVAGVAGVANDIEVRLAGEARPDPEIARDAVAALKLQLPGAVDTLKVVVQNGLLRLEGQLPWHYQRMRAADAVRQVRGVRSVNNQIVIKPSVSVNDVRSKIVAAFHRSATIDAAKLTVEAVGGKVTLGGSVRTWAERSDAEHAAWNAPGVTSVDDRIVINSALSA